MKKAIFPSFGPCESKYQTMKIINTNSTPVYYKIIQDQSKVFRIYPLLGFIPGKALHWCDLSSVLSIPIIGASLLSVISITYSLMSKIYTWVGNASDIRLLMTTKESCSSLQLTL